MYKRTTDLFNLKGSSNSMILQVHSWVTKILLDWKDFEKYTQHY